MKHNFELIIFNIVKLPVIQAPPPPIPGVGASANKMNEDAIYISISSKHR